MAHTDPRRTGRREEAVGRLSREVAGLIQEQVDEAKQDIRDVLGRSSLGAGLLAGTAVLSVLVVASAHSAAQAFLDRHLRPPRGEVLLTGFYAALAAGSAYAAATQLRSAVQVTEEAGQRVRDELHAIPDTDGTA